jgi:hypothetical protein
VNIPIIIRPDQKEKIDAEREKDWGATQDGIVREGLDLYFKFKESGEK